MFSFPTYDNYYVTGVTDKQKSENDNVYSTFSRLFFEDNFYLPTRQKKLWTYESI